MIVGLNRIKFDLRPETAYPLKFGPAMHNMCSSYKEAIAMNFNIYLDDKTGH